MDSLLFERHGHVAVLTLNRPEKFNSINRPLALGIQSALDTCAADESVRCVVIKGNGRAFCAGQDLKEVTDPDGPGLSTIVAEHYNPIIDRIRSIQKPVIAAVNGVAAGAGANIALCCDIVVAAASATFIQAFSKIGLIPDSGGTWFLPRLIGWQRASALMMLGDKISAPEAEQMGMIYKTLPDEGFADAALALAGKMASMPTRGLALTKQALNQTFSNTLQEQLALEDRLQTEAGRTNDYREGVDAFLQKRSPNFLGS
jgi:2-(1,2-epoxy-1,2-dihydrophenyl)acetyl-CoA isomerase